MFDVRGIISTYASGVDVVFEWKIANFFNLPETNGVGYCSPAFSFSGEEWCLDIFPIGSRCCDSSGHVDLRLWKCGSNRSIRQSFKLSLKTVTGEKYNEQNVTKNFKGLDYHSFNRFMPRLELTRRRSELLPEGVLTVVCTMKSSTSAGSASNVAFAKSCHCKGTFNADRLTSHQKKCLHRPVKCPNCLEVVVLQKWFDEHECQQERTEGDAVPTAEVNTSDVAGSAKSAASGSTQGGTTTTKESVMKWIKENCKEASKGKKRKLKEENVLKWIEENCKASKGKKKKLKDENDDGSLCQDFKKLLLEGLNHDLILKVGDKELRAHRDVLRARSRVFKSMLDHDMKEKSSGIIDIPDCDPLAMEQFLFYIYSGNVETLDQSNMLKLYYIADKYEMKGLKKKCSDFIKESLSQANICDVFQLALNHSDSSLLESTIVYFRNNMLGILRTVEWQDFMKDNSTVANEFLIKAVENLSNVKS